MGKRARSFGGSWTEEKLSRVNKYLCAYTKIMAKQRFKFAYIDAFAGAGYRTSKRESDDTGELFTEFIEPETQNFLSGSAKIALQVTPHFGKYIFIEKETSGVLSLEDLKAEYPALARDINIVSGDANSYLNDLCDKTSWAGHRAVLFLDPFEM